tara:strand:- start:2543 stop:3874 length:1332 start_codon:yes stop_codon:yes gene_type:complete
MKTKFTINEINEMQPATQSWDGTNLVSASPVEIRSMYADFYYIVKVDDKTICLPESKGFWLDGGVELFANKIIPGVSNVYVKEDNNVILKKVDSIELVNEFIEYDYLCNTTNHNYILNDFLLHNFDLEDYTLGGWIGCGNVDKTNPTCCNDWEDVLITWRQTTGAWIGQVMQYYLACTSNSIRWADVQNGEYTELLSSWNNDFMPAYVDYYAAAERYFNSFLCSNEQQDGVITGYIDGATVDLVLDTATQGDFVYDAAKVDTSTTTFDLDFTGSLSPDVTLYNQFKDTQLALGGAFAKMIKTVSGMQLHGPDSTANMNLVGQNTFANRNYNTDFVNKTRYITKKFITNGTPDTITHNLGTNNIDVTVYRNTTGQNFGDYIEVPNNNYTLTITGTEYNFFTIEFNNMPDSTYKIIVVGVDESNEQIVNTSQSTFDGCTAPNLGE